jgi:hypothetical protein
MIEANLVISTGPRGVKWKELDIPLNSTTNQLYFCCSQCRKITDSNDTNAHEKGCKNGLLNQLGM